MTPRTKEQSRRDRAKVRAILLEHWDPIGVVDMPEAQDEYDAYGAEAYVMVMDRGANADDVAAYLRWVISDRMGLGEAYMWDVRSKLAADAVVALRDRSEPEDDPRANDVHKRLEQTILSSFLGEPLQTYQDYVAYRDFTEVGFFTHFKGLQLDKANEIYSAGNAEPNKVILAGFVIRVENAKASYLEGFTFGDDRWPAKLTEFSFTPD